MDIQSMGRREVLKLLRDGAATTAIGFGASGCEATEGLIRALPSPVNPTNREGPAAELAGIVRGYNAKDAAGKLSTQNAVYNHFSANPGNYEFATAAWAVRANGEIATLGVEERDGLKRIPLYWTQIDTLVNGMVLPNTQRIHEYEAPRGVPRQEIIDVPQLVIPADTVSGDDLVGIAQKLGHDFRVTMTDRAARQVWQNFMPSVFLYALRLREDAGAIPNLSNLPDRYRGPVPGSGITYAQLTDGKKFNLEIPGTGNHAGLQVYTFNAPSRG